MPYPTDEKGRYVVHQGPRFSVACAVRANGSSPATEFLADLERHDVAKLRQFMVLFDRICQAGMIANKEHFVHERDRIWSFKRYQHRMPCFRDGSTFVLTHGFVKKHDKWRDSDFQAAMAIMQEDLARRPRRPQRIPT